MDQDMYKANVISTIKQLIDCISNGEYDRTPANIDIHKSWYSGDMTRDEAIAEFKEWLDGQLDLWHEEYGEEFVIDAFDMNSLDCNDLDFIEYSPTSHGNRLDFWFEIDVRKTDNEAPLIVFNVNI